MGGASAPTMDASDILAELFGASGFSFGFGPGMGMGRKKKQDTVIPYDVSLEDLYKGKHVKMNMEKEVICAVCQG